MFHPKTTLPVCVLACAIQTAFGSIITQPQPDPPPVYFVSTGAAPSEGATVSPAGYVSGECTVYVWMNEGWFLKDFTVNPPGALKGFALVPSVVPGQTNLLVHLFPTSDTTVVANLETPFPRFAVHPASRVVTVGGETTLHVDAFGPGTLAYQWRRNEQPILGATNASYSLNPVQRNDDAYYDVVVSNSHGSRISSPAHVSVAPPPYRPRSATYLGIFTTTNGTVKHGQFKLVTTASGAYSGTVQLGAKRARFSGKFNGSGGKNFYIWRKDQMAFWMRMQMDRWNDSNQLSCHVADDMLSVFNGGIPFSAHVVSTPNVAPSPHAGVYTAVIAGAEERTVSPGGHGAVSLKVTEAGKIFVHGRLGDGAPLARASALCNDGRWPMFSPLRGSSGGVSGWLQFTNGADMEITGELAWTSPTRPSNASYPGGFHVVTAVMGSAYAQTRGSSVLEVTNKVLVLDRGPLHESLAGILSAVSRSRFVGPNQLNVTVHAKTGLLKGKVFEAGTGTFLPFRGAILQSHDAAYGYFIEANQTGRMSLSDP